MCKIIRKDSFSVSETTEDNTINLIYSIMQELHECNRDVEMTLYGNGSGRFKVGLREKNFSSLKNGLIKIQEMLNFENK